MDGHERHKYFVAAMGPESMVLSRCVASRVKNAGDTSSKLGGPGQQTFGHRACVCNAPFRPSLDIPCNCPPLKQRGLESAASELGDVSEHPALQKPCSNIDLGIHVPALTIRASDIDLNVVLNITFALAEFGPTPTDIAHVWASGPWAREADSG